MLNRTMEDWERLRDLPALLNELPSLAEELGFHYYSFAFTSTTHEVNSEHLLAGGQAIVQAALDFRPPHLQRSSIPLIWGEKAFAMAPLLWTEAKTLGLHHGWVQPLSQGATQSHLALLRPHVSLSIAELYQKAAHVMWLGERLHLAASQSDETLEYTHRPRSLARKLRPSGE